MSSTFMGAPFRPNWSHSATWSSTDFNIVPFDTKKQIETRTAQFASSHFDVSVEVVGVPALTKATGYPTIEMVGVSPQTDFNNKAKGQSTTYVMEGSHNGNQMLFWP